MSIQPRAFATLVTTLYLAKRAQNRTLPSQDAAASLLPDGRNVSCAAGSNRSSALSSTSESWSLEIGPDCERRMQSLLAKHTQHGRPHFAQGGRMSTSEHGSLSTMASGSEHWSASTTALDDGPKSSEALSDASTETERWQTSPGFERVSTCANWSTSTCLQHSSGKLNSSTNGVTETAPIVGLCADVADAASSATWASCWLVIPKARPPSGVSLLPSSDTNALRLPGEKISSRLRPARRTCSDSNGCK
mmetsp:Transcript_109303/g.308430  ORF Transcript_109303/g.308430 Transcript_109303/m.308430 type:complete len:249 (-) Transcript_109303:306-1052(-)